jgi:hypothetical protein
MQYNSITIYEVLPVVGMDSVLSIPDLNSSPRTLTSPATQRDRHSAKPYTLPQKVKRKRRIRKKPADCDLDREEIDLDQDEVLRILFFFPFFFTNKSHRNSRKPVEGG